VTALYKCIQQVKLYYSIIQYSGKVSRISSVKMRIKYNLCLQLILKKNVMTIVFSGTTDYIKHIKNIYFLCILICGGTCGYTALAIAS